MKKFLVWSICLLFLVGCAVHESSSPSDASAINDSIVTTPVSPTKTLLPTATSLPAATATLSFPLTNGTPLPPATQPITAENVANLRQLLLWSQNPLGQIVFSSDGSLLVYATSEWVHIYDVQSKTLVTEIETFISPPGQDGNLAISNDNQRIMLVQNAIVKVIDQTGKALLSAPTTSGEASLSPDGKLLGVLDYCNNENNTLIANCQVSVFNIDSGEITASYPGESIEFSPDGESLIIKQGNFLYFRQISDGTILRHFDPDNYLNELISWRLSPDGSTFIVIHGDYNYGVPKTIDLVTISDNKLVATYIETAQSAFVSLNNQYLAIVDYDKVNIYDLTDKKSVYSGEIPASHFSSDIQGVNDDGTLSYAVSIQEIIGSAEPIQITQNLDWKDNAFYFLKEPNYSQTRQYCKTDEQGVASCSLETKGFLAMDGNIYEADADIENITLFKDVGDTQEIAAQMNWKNQAYKNVTGASVLAYVPGKDFLALKIKIGSNSSRVIIVDLVKELVIYSWDWDEVQPDMAVISPSANFMAFKISGRNYAVNKGFWDEGLFDFNKGWYVWNGGASSSYLLRFSHDEKYFLEVQDRDNAVSIVYVYDFLRYKQVAFYEMQREFSGEFGACTITDADISIDNQIAFYACKDGTIQVADLLSGEKVFRWQAFNEPVTEISLSEDGTRLTAGASGFIKMWDIQ